MKFLGFELTREHKNVAGGDVLARLIAAQQNGGIGFVTPENCMQSPTVHAIVTAISRRISVSPVHVYKKTTSNGLDAKEKQPNHPIERLLSYPNSWQTRSSYWLDAASTFVRYGRYYAWKSRGSTGPIRELLPIKPSEISVSQDPNTWKVSYRRGTDILDSSKIHNVRGPARNFIEGDSPVNDVSVAISLEIMAEKYGSSFFSNGAMPGLIFSFLAGSGGFKSPEEAQKFREDFDEKFSGTGRFKGMVLPKGFDKPYVLPTENDKAQMIESRKHQRTVIAGAFGVPPHLVGDLDRATFNNVEQQDVDFTSNVIMPVAQAFESAMERDLLTDSDRANGIIIRFNLDSIQRADFKSRQEGLQIRRRNGVVNANEWREMEGLNPISTEQGGDDYIHESNMVVAGEEVSPKDPTEQVP